MPTERLSAFFAAVRSDDDPSVRAALDLHPDWVDARSDDGPDDDRGQSPLQIALRRGAYDVAWTLLDRDADPTYIEPGDDEEWRAPVLHDAIRACAFGSRPELAIRLVRRLLDLGADPNQVDSYSNAPLHRALLDAMQLADAPERWATMVAVFRALLDAGADPDRATEWRDAPDRQQRGQWGYRFLVQAYAPVAPWAEAVWRDEPVWAGEPDARGSSPLHHAAVFGSVMSARALLDAGADPNAVDASGWPPLPLCWWSVDTTRVLLEGGADPNQPVGDTGFTAFSWSWSRPDLARLLAAHGGDPSTPHPHGLKPPG